MAEPISHRKRVSAAFRPMDIVDALRAEGLVVRWDGSDTTRIEVTTTTIDIKPS